MTTVFPSRLETDSTHRLQRLARQLQGPDDFAFRPKLDSRLDWRDGCLAFVLDQHKEEEALGRPRLDEPVVVDEHAPGDRAQPDVGVCNWSRIPSLSGEHRAYWHTRQERDDTDPRIRCHGEHRFLSELPPQFSKKYDPGDAGSLPRFWRYC